MTKYIKLTVLVILFSLLVVGCSNSPESYLKRCRKYSEKAENIMAVQCYSRVIDMAPVSSEAAIAHQNRGSIYLKLGEYKKAIEDVNTALKMDDYNESLYSPEISRGLAYYLRGKSYFKLGDFGQALSDYDKAVEMVPKAISLYYDRGVLLIKLKKHNEALADFNKVIEMAPEFEMGGAYYQLAKIYNRQGRLFQAAETVTALLNKYPEYAFWSDYSDRAGVYFDMKDYKNAIKDFSRAIKMNPTEAILYLDRGNAYYNIGEFRKAKDNFIAAIKLDPYNENAKIAFKNLGLIIKRIEAEGQKSSR